MLFPLYVLNPRLRFPLITVMIIAANILVMPALQSLALALSISRGQDPDAPRHLDQVVVLDGR